MSSVVSSRDVRVRAQSRRTGTTQSLAAGLAMVLPVILLLVPGAQAGPSVESPRDSGPQERSFWLVSDDWLEATRGLRGDSISPIEWGFGTTLLESPVTLDLRQFPAAEGWVKHLGEAGPLYTPKGFVDPLIHGGLPQFDNARDSATPGLFLIQFAMPPTAALVSSVVGDDLAYVSSWPRFGILVYGPGYAVDRISDNADVRWTGPFPGWMMPGGAIGDLQASEYLLVEAIRLENADSREARTAF